ncbi:flagellar motor protein [Alishewanella sp. SMS8]|uniref:flagellar motor protein n=1 Tax=unclassified Alishewanella TaxID=2628974 RepID=UPI00274108E5|nr:flagellar motor protein [Alishewanella sp. SMS8]MDP4946557.1 flagellar motor protein [Alishewanella sp.]MDP5207862.1 flagellar motor protein [Alishewanella sp. SMS9]MDP5036547.1 flagellar motor protein [Alishewanella sp.]MDP5187291.1 flagellar motor protein [Alishewanella sp.]MDP5459970.1 flagellar motor protein [Alishewanella sp. SMS8]
MDKLAFIGFILAVVAVAGGFVLEGGTLSTLMHLPAFIIVFGGTLGAVMLQTPFQQFRLGLSMLPWAFLPRALPVQQTMNRIVEWGNSARANGFLSLESAALEESDPFLHRGLNLLVDGAEADTLQITLDAELSLTRERLLRGARIFEAMGGYSPTIGIIGAVLGLIQAMSHISDPDRLGLGIATAFVATIYGVGFANLVFIPLGNKLKNLVQQQSLYHELIIEGLVSIAQGQNPRTIERKLAAYRPG